MKMLKKILMHTVLFLNHPVRMVQAAMVCWLMEARQTAYIVRARRASVPKVIAGFILRCCLPGGAVAGVAQGIY